MSNTLAQQFAKAERSTVVAATKLTPTEHAAMLAVVDDLNKQGVDATASSLLRVALLSWVRAWNESEAA